MQPVITPLGPHHADVVRALFEKVNGTVPNGFLTDRSTSEFEGILSEPQTSASVGAWVGERLVGYALGIFETGVVHPESPLMRHVQATGGRICSGRGTIVDPEFQGKLLMLSLMRERWEQMQAKGMPNLAGLIAVSNIGSLVNTFRAGTWMVGLEHDGECENFVTYFGEYAKRLETVDEVIVEHGNLEKLRTLFENGWIAVSLERHGPERSLVLRRVPELKAPKS